MSLFLKAPNEKMQEEIFNFTDIVKKNKYFLIFRSTIVVTVENVVTNINNLLRYQGNIEEFSPMFFREFFDNLFYIRGIMNMFIIGKTEFAYIKTIVTIMQEIESRRVHEVCERFLINLYNSQLFLVVVEKRLNEIMKNEIAMYWYVFVNSMKEFINKGKTMFEELVKLTNNVTKNGPMNRRFKNSEDKLDDYDKAIKKYEDCVTYINDPTRNTIETKCNKECSDDQILGIIQGLRLMQPSLYEGVCNKKPSSPSS